MKDNLGITKENENSQIINLTKLYYHPFQKIEIDDSTFTTNSGIKLMVSTYNHLFSLNYKNSLDIYSQNLNDGSNKKIIIGDCNDIYMNNTMAYYYCTGNLSDIEIGHSKIISYDQCKKEKEVGNIVIVNEDSQRLISISPDFVNIKEKKDISITLTYSKIFENNPSKIYLVNKNTEKIANGKYIDISGINERNITFNINYDFIS